MNYLRLILTLYVSITLIPLKAQCDSTIVLCPKTFDYLIKQDIFAKKYYQESINLLVLNGLQKENLQIKDSLLLDKDNIILYLNAQKGLYDKHLGVVEFNLKQQKRQKNFYKFLSIAVGFVGVTSTTYFIIK